MNTQRKNVTAKQIATMAISFLALSAFAAGTNAQAQSYIPSVIHNYDTFAPIANSQVMDAQRANLDAQNQMRMLAKAEKRAQKEHRKLLKQGLCKHNDTVQQICGNSQPEDITH